MGYLPPPAKGVLFIEVGTPPAADDIAWWDTSTGALLRWDGTYLNEWVPVGEPPPTVAYHALALGRAPVGDVYSVSIGDTNQTDVAGPFAVVVGNQAAAPGTNDVVIGANAASEPGQSGQLVIGYGATSQVANAIVLGYNARAESSGSGQGVNSLVIGLQAKALDATNAIVIGIQAEARGSNAVVIGNSAKTTTPDVANAVVIGGLAEASDTGAVAIGDGTKTHAANAVALGTGALVDGSNGTALGSGAKASGENATAVGVQAEAAHGQSTAIGPSAVTTADFQAMVSADELVVKSPKSDPTTLVLHSPDGTAWRIAVDDTGALSTSPA